jgi:hypothetical protein
MVSGSSSAVNRRGISRSAKDNSYRETYHARLAL